MGFMACMPGGPPGQDDLQLTSNDADLLEAAEDFFGHAFGEVHEAVVLADVDMPDMTALEPRLIGDGPNNVARLHAVDVPDFDAEGFVCDVF